MRLSAPIDLKMFISYYLQLNIKILSELIYEELYLFLLVLLSKIMISDTLDLCWHLIFIIRMYHLIHITIIVIIIISMKASYIYVLIFIFHPTYTVNFKDYLLLDIFTSNWRSTDEMFNVQIYKNTET